MKKYRLLKGLWFDGKEKRCWWKFQKRTLFGWRTIRWTSFEDTAAYLGEKYDCELAFDKSFK